MPKKTDRKSTPATPLAAAATQLNSALKNEKPVPAKTAKNAVKGSAASKSTAKKSPVGKKKPSARLSITEATPPAPSEEAVRLRAYFIAERRHRESIPGNSDTDWIEARRQLRREAGVPDAEHTVSAS